MPRSWKDRPFAVKKAEQLWRLVRESHENPLSGTSRPLELVSRDQLGVTFIGHSSFLLQIDGKKVLIDPVFSKRLILLRRQRRPGLRMDELPAIDLVLLTHAHMDHLDLASLRRVVRATTMTPCKHWGARMFRDTHRGYGGYVVEAGGHSVYHSGDTAYFKGFREIGLRLQPEIALLPIGAYFPDSYRSVHTSPEEALRAFIELNARQMVPMHYGTFRLGREPIDEPLQRLEAEATRLGVKERVRVLGEGETMHLCSATRIR